MRTVFLREEQELSHRLFMGLEIHFGFRNDSIR